MTRHDSLKAFSQPTEEEFRLLWTKGTFFVDANVLLNLYRYPTAARDDLLRVLEQFGNRLAAPFHALLEYERNRLTVVAEQKKRFRDVRDVVAEKREELQSGLDALQLRKRHGSIRADEYVSQLSMLTDEFLKNLDNLEAAQPDVFTRDELRERIYKLLDNHISPPPTKQQQLDDIFAAGAARYARLTPPGYLDAHKGGASDEFEFGGLLYRRQFGDLIVWKQLMAVCESAKLKQVCFVTDDDKEDWWWTIDSQGKKKIGARPELIEEIRRTSGVEMFHMYNSDQLVRWSSKYLEVTVQSESAEQIRDAKQVNIFRFRPIKMRRDEEAVTRWVRERHPDATLLNLRPFPDILVEAADGTRIGYEVTHLHYRSSALLLTRLREIMLRAYYEVHQQNFDQLWLVLLEIDPGEGDRVLQAVREREGTALASRVGLVFGSILGADDDEDPIFEASRIVPPQSRAS